MNRYAALRERQQEEFNALPLGFAFSQKQFNSMMMEWGLDPEKDADKICRIPGGYVQKRNVDLLHQTMERHDAEMTAAIEGDQTGEDFIYEMFLYELDNHEYGYTMDAEDTLDALGYTSAQVLEDPRLKRGLEKAAAEICGREND